MTVSVYCIFCLFNHCLMLYLLFAVGALSFCLLFYVAFSTIITEVGGKFGNNCCVNHSM